MVVRQGVPKLDDKVALVTGASRGIGRAIASELGALGAIVIGTATTEAGAAGITSLLKERGIAGEGMRLDVTEAATIDSCIEQIAARFGSPLVLVNNAGITRDNVLLRMKDADWNDVIDTNLGAVFRLSRACIRAMSKAHWGRIINISSVVGSMGNAGQINYAATKAGVEGVTRALAREIGKRGVTVNAVAPGFIDTDMTHALADSQRTALCDQVPLGRMGTPQDIANMVAFLASDLASYITGATLHVNGGLYMG